MPSDGGFVVVVVVVVIVVVVVVVGKEPLPRDTPAPIQDELRDEQLQLQRCTVKKWQCYTLQSGKRGGGRVAL